MNYDCVRLSWYKFRTGNHGGFFSFFVQLHVSTGVTLYYISIRDMPCDKYQREPRCLLARSSSVLSSKNLPVVWSRKNTSNNLVLLLWSFTGFSKHIQHQYCLLVALVGQQETTGHRNVMPCFWDFWEILIYDIWPLINSSWYDTKTLKHENWYIETKVSTNVQASNKREKKLLSYSKRKKRSNTCHIYLYIY